MRTYECIQPLCNHGPFRDMSFARTADEDCDKAYSIQCHWKPRYALSFVAPNCEKVSVHSRIGQTSLER